MIFRETKTYILNHRTLVLILLILCSKASNKSRPEFNSNLFDCKQSLSTTQRTVWMFSTVLSVVYFFYDFFSSKHLQSTLPYVRTTSAVILMKDILWNGTISESTSTEWLIAIAMFDRYLLCYTFTAIRAIYLIWRLILFYHQSSLMTWKNGIPNGKLKWIMRSLHI